MQCFGMYATRLYGIWENMKTRCTNPKYKGFRHYGGRGIKLCAEWNNSKVFILWAIKNGYQDDLYLDRIDNNKGYGPENCRWATRKEQENNKRTNHLITIDGETKDVTQWEEAMGFRQNAIFSRLYRGWTPREAVLVPSGMAREEWAAQAGEGGGKHKTD